jgi:two-component system, LuxR family, sensor kinase FixL
MLTTEFTRFAECFTEAMLMLSRDGRLLAGNSSSGDLLGVTCEALDERLLSDFVHDSPEQVEAYLAACANSDQPIVGALHFRSQEAHGHTICQGRALRATSSDDGSTPILLRCLPGPELNHDDHALSASLIQLKQEIDHRHRVEDQLSSSMAHARAVLETAADAIITIDADGGIQAFNPAAERMFGYRAAEVIGKNVHLLMPAPYRHQHDDYMSRYLRTGEKRIIGIGREVQALRRDGTVFPIELAVSEVCIRGAHHFTGIIRDISERKQSERRLQRREEEARQHRERLVHVGRLSTMGELATGIAHEINQPLTAIAAYANACRRLLERGAEEPVELVRILDKISSQAQRAGQVIQRLRDMIRKRDSRREACELNRLIRDTLVLAESDVRLHHYSITTELVERPLPVVVDPIQIQQVLLNLIRNGLDAMLEVRIEQGDIRVGTRLADEETVEVLVRDQGVGIPAERRDKLFSPFFTTKPQGIGLGLSISRSIVTAHGGRLDCLANPHRGVTMRFTLPLALEDMND